MKYAVPILTCLALFFAFVTAERYAAYRAELDAINEVIEEIDTATVKMADAFGRLGSVMGTPPKTKYTTDNRIKPGFPPVCIYSSMFSIICGASAVALVVKSKMAKKSSRDAIVAERTATETATAIDTYFK